MRTIVPLLLPAMLGACTVQGVDETAGSAGAAAAGQTQMDTQTIKGTIGPAGFLTIRKAPPQPFPATVPDDPTEGQEDDIGRFARENGLSRMEAERLINGPPELRAEMARIAERVRTENPGNFVQFIMVRDPAVRMEAWFERDAAATLARYTDSPLIVARQGGISLTEQERMSQVWLERARSHPAIGSVSTQNMSRRIEIGVGIPEAEFRALAAREGWELGPGLLLLFAPDQPDAFGIDGLDKLVRVFPREHIMPGARNQALAVGRIVLDDGCFRLERDEGTAPLVMFGYLAALRVDSEGYLTVETPTQPGSYGYRIGEIGAWGGPAWVDESNPDVQELRRECGGGEIVNVTEPVSNRLFSLPDPSWVSDYARAKRLSRQQAWDEIIGCMKRRDPDGSGGLDARNACVDQFN